MENNIDCYYGKAAVARASWTLANPGRRFYGCRECEVSRRFSLNLWEHIDRPPISPPDAVKLLGRPKKMRRKDPVEEEGKKKGTSCNNKFSRAGSMIYKSKKCNELGHNSRKCPSKNERVDESQGATEMSQDSVEMFSLNSDIPSGFNSTQQTVAPSSKPSAEQAKKRKQSKCAICGQPEHNRSTCQTEVVKLCKGICGTRNSKRMTVKVVKETMKFK